MADNHDLPIPFGLLGSENNPFRVSRVSGDGHNAPIVRQSDSPALCLHDEGLGCFGWKWIEESLDPRFSDLSHKQIDLASRSYEFRGNHWRESL